MSTVIPICLPSNILSPSLSRTPQNHQTSSTLTGRTRGITLLRSTSESLAPVLEQVIAELRVDSPERVIETELLLSLPISCDHARIGQLFSNLLANAHSYGSPDEPIIVRAATTADTFELSVSNAGDPIAPEAMARLFLPFARGEVRPSQQGLGLGLYIASEIARAHGGTLTVASTGEQTRFTLRMPRM